MASDQPTLAAALAELQTSLPAVHKTSEAQYGKYADLAVVSAALLPVMGKLGLSFSAKPTMRDGESGREFGLAYTLRLAGSDETDEGFYPLSMVIEKGPQAIGSAITYARRYCLCAVTGVAPDSDDDDAQAAQPQAAAAPRRQRGKPPERAPGNLPRHLDGAARRAGTGVQQGHDAGGGTQRGGEAGALPGPVGAGSSPGGNRGGRRRR